MPGDNSTWTNLLMNYIDKRSLEKINEKFKDFEEKIYSEDFDFEEIKTIIKENNPSILDEDLFKIEAKINDIRNWMEEKTTFENSEYPQQSDVQETFDKLLAINDEDKKKEMLTALENNISYNKPISVTSQKNKNDDIYKSREPFFAPLMNVDLFEGILGYKPFIDNSLMKGFDQKEFLKHYTKVMKFKIESNVKTLEFGIEYTQNIYSIYRKYDIDQKTLRHITCKLFITNLLSNVDPIDYRLVTWCADTDGMQKNAETLGPAFYFKCFKHEGYLYLFCEDITPFRIIFFSQASAAITNVTGSPNSNAFRNIYGIELNRYLGKRADSKEVTFPSESEWNSNTTMDFEKNQFDDLDFTDQLLSNTDSLDTWKEEEKNQQFVSSFDAVKLRQYVNLEKETDNFFNFVKNSNPSDNFYPSRGFKKIPNVYTRNETKTNSPQSSINVSIPDTINKNDIGIIVKHDDNYVLYSRKDDITEVRKILSSNDLDTDTFSIFNIKNIETNYSESIDLIQDLKDGNSFITKVIERKDPDDDAIDYIEEIYKFDGFLDAKNNRLFMNRYYARKNVKDNTKTLVVFDDTLGNTDINRYIQKEKIEYQFPYLPSSISLVDNRLIVFFVNSNDNEDICKVCYSDDFGKNWVESENVLPISINKTSGGWISRVSEDSKVLFALKVGEYNNDSENMLLVSYDKGNTFHEIPLSLNNYFPSHSIGNIQNQLKDFTISPDGSYINLIDSDYKLYYNTIPITLDNLNLITFDKATRFNENDNYGNNDNYIHSEYHVEYCYFHKNYQHLYFTKGHIRFFYQYTKSDINKYFHDEIYVKDIKTRIYPTFLTNINNIPYNDLYDIYSINDLGDLAYNSNLLISGDNQEQMITASAKGSNPFRFDDTVTKYGWINMHAKNRVLNYNRTKFYDKFGMDFEVLLSIADSSAFTQDYSLDTISYKAIENIYLSKKQNNEVLSIDITLPKVGMFTLDGISYTGEKINLVDSHVIKKLFRHEILSLDHETSVTNFVNSIHEYIKERLKRTENNDALVEYKIYITHPNNKYNNDLSQSPIIKILKNESQWYETISESSSILKIVDTFGINKYKTMPCLSIFNAIGIYNIDNSKSVFYRYYKNALVNAYNTTNIITNLNELNDWYHLKYDAVARDRLNLDSNSLVKSQKINDPLSDLPNIFNKTNEDIIGSSINISVTIYPTHPLNVVDYKQTTTHPTQSNKFSYIMPILNKGDKLVTTERSILYGPHTSDININGGGTIDLTHHLNRYLYAEWPPRQYGGSITNVQIHRLYYDSNHQLNLHCINWNGTTDPATYSWIYVGNYQITDINSLYFTDKNNMCYANNYTHAALFYVKSIDRIMFKIIDNRGAIDRIYGFTPQEAFDLNYIYD